jgi:outer membrane lipoprotein-sorting protein
MSRALLFCSVFTAILATPCFAQVETPAPSSQQTASSGEPAAVFSRLRDYLVSNPLDFQTTFTARSDTLGTLQGTLHFLVQRPNLFRIESSSGHGSYVVISDGKVMTIYKPRDQKYAQVPAPSTPREGLGLVTGLMAMESQTLVLLGVIEDVAEGGNGVQVTVGDTETISGRQCEGFTIVETTEVVTTKWRVWLEKSDVPLVCKFVTGSTESLADAMQTNEFNWKQNPSFPLDAFVFTPPKGSEKVDVGGLGLEPYY